MCNGWLVLSKVRTFIYGYIILSDNSHHSSLGEFRKTTGSAALVAITFSRQSGPKRFTSMYCSYKFLPHFQKRKLFPLTRGLAPHLTRCSLHAKFYERTELTGKQLSTAVKIMSPRALFYPTTTVRRFAPLLRRVCVWAVG